MPASRGSSTPATISNPSEVDVARALAAPDFPCWADEPLVSVLAERLGATQRALRPLIERVPWRFDVSGARLGQLDESWLFRAPSAPASLAERLAGVEGVVAWDALDAHVIVRTWSQDAVERERRLRALHAKLGERPLAQLHRPAPAPLARKPTRADWALVAAMRAKPWAPLADIAREAEVTARVAKARVARLSTEGILSIEALLPESWHVVVRLSPSSSAAARAALAAFEPVLLRSHVPDATEASLADALVAAPSSPMRAQALDVPGVASVEVSPRRASWRDEAGIAERLRRARLTASV